MPAIRGSSKNNAHTDSCVVAIPGAAVAGDQAFLFAAGGYPPQLPSGYTLITNTSGGFYSGAIYTKVLGAADILLGTIQVNFDNSDNYCNVCCVVMVGEAANRIPTTLRQGQPGSANNVLAAPVATLSTDLVLLYGSQRATNITDTIDVGTVLQTVFADGSCAVLGWYDPPSDGTFNVTFGYTSGNDGTYQAVLPLYDGIVATDPIVGQLMGYAVATDEIPEAPVQVGMVMAYSVSTEFVIPAVYTPFGIGQYMATMPYWAPPFQ